MNCKTQTALHSIYLIRLTLPLYNLTKPLPSIDILSNSFIIPALVIPFPPPPSPLSRIFPPFPIFSAFPNYSAASQNHPAPLFIITFPQNFRKSPQIHNPSASSKNAKIHQKSPKILTLFRTSSPQFPAPPHRLHPCNFGAKNLKQNP